MTLPVFKKKHQKHSASLSIIIPAYDEEKKVGKTLKKIMHYCDSNLKKYEILVVNDCSRDNTEQVVAQVQNKYVCIIRNALNRGKGFAVRKGMLHARMPLVLFSDSDLATPIEEVGKMMKEIEKGADIVIASRNLSESRIIMYQPWYRQIMGKTFLVLVRLVLGLSYKDTQCGFKLFTREAAQKCFSKAKIDRFAFDVEILYIAKKMNMKVKEAPVTWIDKKGSSVHILRDSMHMMIDLIRIRINDFVFHKYE